MWTAILILLDPRREHALMGLIRIAGEALLPRTVRQALGIAGTASAYLGRRLGLRG